MGNRAVIAFNKRPTKTTPTVYLHWNGGRASIEGFLKAAQELGIHDLPTFGKMVLKWIGSSVYFETYGTSDCDNFDNGVYLIDPDQLTIIGRRFIRGDEEIDQDKTDKIAAECVEKWNEMVAAS